MSAPKLEDLRKQIDSIDKDLYELIQKRAQLAVHVADVKRSSPEATFYRPEREAQVLRKIMKNNTSALSDTALAQIFRDIMTACLALQKQLQIAYLGPQGTFSQMATLKHFGKATALVAQQDIPHIFRAIEAEQADYGVVPIENSTEGMVNLSLDSLLNSRLQICGEIEIPIHQQLMRAKTDTATVAKIYAHDHSFAQCRQWLSKHHPEAEQISVSSNAAAADKLILEPGSAMLGAALASELYDLNIVEANIEDISNNTTRFLIIGKQHPPVSGNDKTSLLISTPHSPGALSKLLQPFAKHDINMTSIASRPYRHRNWSYLFFIDIEGHQDEQKVRLALKDLEENSVMMNVLGSYPKAVL